MYIEILQAVSHCAFSGLRVLIHIKFADISSYSMHLIGNRDSTLSFWLVKISSPCACVANLFVNFKFQPEFPCVWVGFTRDGEFLCMIVQIEKKRIQTAYFLSNRI